MQGTQLRAACLASAASLMFGAGAFAQTSDLEARVRELEAALASVRAEMAQQKAAGAAEAERLVLLEKKAAAPAAPAPAPAAADGFKVGNTTVKINGFIKAEAIASRWSDGDVASGPAREFFVAGATPFTGGTQEDVDLDFHAKQTRLWLSTNTAVEGHKIGTWVEVDFQTSPGTQGTERTSNGYNLAMRRVYLTYDKWLFGQDWTTFQNISAYPETTDFIGSSDGMVFGRQAMIRYTTPAGKTGQFSIAAENAETAYITTTSAAMQEPDDDSLPDVIARYTFKPSFGEISLAGIVRKLDVDSGTSSASATGAGVSLAGKIKAGAQDDLRFMVTAGSGIGRYVGLNFAPDAVLTSPTNLETVDVLAAYASYRHVWSPRARSNVMIGFQDVGGDVVVPGATNDESLSYALNYFFSPAKSVDLGIEFRHHERTIASGADGSLDRLHFIAKQTF